MNYKLETLHFELQLAPLDSSGLLWGCSGAALGSSGLLWAPLGLLWGSPGLLWAALGSSEVLCASLGLRLASPLSGSRARARNVYIFNR